MKSIICTGLLAALLGAAPAAHAQLSAGHFLLSGQIGYSQTKNGTGDNSTITSSGWISPQAGFFLVDNLAVGVLVNYQVSSREIKNGGNSTKTKVSPTETAIGPFVRYYKPVGEHAAFFGQASVTFGTSTNSEYDPYNGAKEVKYSELDGAITPGFTWLPTDHFGVEVTLGNLRFNHEKQKDLPAGDDAKDYTSNTFEASFGLQMLRVGAAWYIGGK